MISHIIIQKLCNLIERLENHEIYYIRAAE